MEAIVCHHLTVARAAEALGVAWNTANDAVLSEGRRVLIADPDRFDGVRVIGVDEHVWRHTRRGDKYVTVVIDLTPVRDGTGPARLLDMVDGRSKQAFKAWLAAQPAGFRDRVESVAMDGFTGFKTAAQRRSRTRSRSWIRSTSCGWVGTRSTAAAAASKQDLHGHRGLAGDPLCRARRTLYTGTDLLTDRQIGRLEVLFARIEHIEVKATWGIYQRMIGAYREPAQRRGRHLMQQLITDVGRGVPRPRSPNSRPSAAPSSGGPPTCWPTSTGPAPPTGRQRPSMADSNTSRLRARLPEPHQLHRPIAPREWRLPPATTPLIVMSR